MTEDHQHTSPIKTPKQLIVVVLLAFLVPVVLILLITQLVTSGHKGSPDGKSDESRVLERIQPVGTVQLADASGPAGNLTGVQVFDQVCKTCHGAGIAGAPKVGDKAAWTPRIAQGDKVLFQHALAGFQGKSGMMPPKGGNADLADVEVERAVVYMANQSGGNLKEPPAPSAPTQAAAPAGAAGVASAGAGAGTAQAREASSPAPAAPAGPVPAAAPAGTVVAAAAPSAPAPAPGAGAGGKADGKKVFETTCSVCHGAGIAGAPKFGDKAAWAPRIAQGTGVLYQHALQGFQGKSGVMPPKGGNTSLGEADVKAAVDYMAAAAK